MYSNRESWSFCQIHLIPFLPGTPSLSPFHFPMTIPQSPPSFLINTALSPARGFDVIPISLIYKMKQYFDGNVQLHVQHYFKHFLNK